jgi:acyl-CoA synthetase (AMP-forming)/AMP-acid ligase II
MHRSQAPAIAFKPTLPELLHRAAARYGGDDFVVMRDRRISFDEAERASWLLADRLLTAGVGKGTRIGLTHPTGIDWVIAWLASARIGAMPMLFPATYRPAELQRALLISDAAVLLACRSMLGKDYEEFLEQALPELGDHPGGALQMWRVPFLRQIWMPGPTRPWATPVSLDIPDERWCRSDILAAVEDQVSPADPLLVMYTSGSSADPKAVVHTHGACIRKVQPELGMSLPGSLPGRTFCAMPFFWVGGPQDLLGALHSGAAIVTQERFDSGECLDLMEREGCTTILGSPWVLDQLRNHPTFASRRLEGLELPLARMHATSRRGDPANRGMTETFGPHHNRDWFDYKVVDPDTGEELPDGEPGEFCVRGFGLMAGIYKKEREAVFDADGWYHTGDRGYVQDGQIWFLGRYSEMVKSAGANVSPLEIERVLVSFADVADAVALGVPDKDRGQVIAAVVVPAPGATLDRGDLERRVNAELSAFKVPRHWLILAEQDLPRLANGKPDKQTLKNLFI